MLGGSTQSLMGRRKRIEEGGEEAATFFLVALVILGRREGGKGKSVTDRNTHPPLPSH